MGVASLAMLMSCTVPTRVETGHPTAEATAVPAGAYQIDAAASTLHILVYRGGAMAALGHNHVISTRNLRGSIWRGATLAESGFDIDVPVRDLIVDDSAARAAEGDDFAAAVSTEARDGTRANMLRASMLDGERYPDIHIRAVSVQGEPTAPTVIAAIRIKDQTRQVSMPVRLTIGASTLRAAGTFEIRQTDFGITPLSVALGALQVQDTIRIKFELVARAP